MKTKLIHSTDEKPGIYRKKNGIGIYYTAADGKKISAKRTIQRIEELVIPPNWQDVWICPSPNGHIQAVGKDAKGRKQYIYHPKYIEQQQAEKFSKLLQFGQNLPAIREAIDANLRKHGWGIEKVLAVVLLILDEYYLRIGNNVYKNDNGTFGLTTLRRKHLQKEERKLKLSYQAKSGKLREVDIDNKTVARLIEQCAALPGYELFKYFDEDGNRHLVGSADVNAFLKEITGKPFTSKDFRTWGGTALAIKHYPDALEVVAEKPRKKLKTEIVRQVATRLGNTLSVCEKYYIHPEVLEYLSSEPAKLVKYHTRKPDLKEYLEEEELILMGILRRE